MVNGGGLMNTADWFSLAGAGEVAGAGDEYADMSDYYYPWRF